MSQGTPDVSAGSAGGQGPREEPTKAPSVALDLTGDLPCAGCGYNLRGLSIRGECPECGVPVRAAILARVDPKASEIQPITRPRLVASGLLCWSGGALLAACLTWLIHLAGLADLLRGVQWQVSWCPAASTAAIILSGFGAITLIRPHRGVPNFNSAVALVAILAYGALALVHWQIVGVLDASTPSPYFSPGREVPELVQHRTRLRLTAGCLLATITLCLRPNARLLVMRSLVLRTGRVDRQTMLAVLAAILVVALGDAMGLLSWRLRGPLADVTATSSLFLIAVGSMLLTLGLAGIFIDTLRLIPVVLRRPLALGDVLGGDEPETPGDAG